MSKVKFSVKENKNLGTHSFFAVPAFTGTLTSEELMEKACKNTSYEVSMGRAIISEYMKTVQEFLLMGYRCQLGDNFLFVYPNIQLSVKDELNQDGSIKKAATADMLKGSMAKGKVGCTVSSKFSKRFDIEVSWSKTDKNGNEVEDDATENNENVESGSDNTQNSNNAPVNNEENNVTIPEITGNTSFSESTQVSIQGPQGATIYYTLDGSTPTTSSSIYSNPIALTETTTVKAIAVLNGIVSEVASKVFTKSSGGDLGQN